jgi:hypothetical protein
LKLLKRLWHWRLVYLVFHISPQVEIPWSEAWVSRGPMNGSCSSYPSLLHLRHHCPSIVIGVPLMIDMLQLMLPMKTWWLSLLFSSCFMFVSSTVLKIP